MTINAGENVDKLDQSYVTSRYIKWYSNSKIVWQFFSKWTYQTPQQLCFWGLTSEKLRHFHIEACTQMFITLFITLFIIAKNYKLPNSPILNNGTTMVKPIVIYLYVKIVLSNKKGISC